MDDRLDPALGEDPVDKGAVGDRADDLGVGAGDDVEAGDVVAERSKARSEISAEPARRSGEEDAHRYALAAVLRSRNIAGGCAMRLRSFFALALLGCLN